MTSIDQILATAGNEDMWSLLLHAGSLDYSVDGAIGAQEPAFVSKYAFQLAQAFNNFYHKHHILSESDEQKQAFLLGSDGIGRDAIGTGVGFVGDSGTGKDVVWSARAGFAFAAFDGPRISVLMVAISKAGTLLPHSKMSARRHF